MTQIQPITVPTKGIGTHFQIATNGFIINPSNPPTSIPFYWQVFASNTDSEIVSYTPVLQDNIYMDVETYSQWGTNDEFVIQWACNLLGFIIL